MTGQPDAATLFEVLEATWPATTTLPDGPWIFRTGQGGGKRVNATTARAPITPADLQYAEQTMQATGQRPLFMLRGGDDALDRMLAGAGYTRIDPTVLYAAPIGNFTGEPLPRISAFDIWPPLAIMVELWAEGGIGGGRMAVMARAASPKTGILARQSDHPAGAAFVSIVNNVAMIHAIEVSAKLRRQGVARNIMRAAAFWAQDQGATTLSLAVTEANAAARSLYASFAMQVAGHYHYRVKPGAG